MSDIYSWVSFEYHLQYHLGCHFECHLGCHFECHLGCHLECHLGCHYIISLYLTLYLTLNLTLLHLNLTLLHLNLTLLHLNLTLQVTPLLTKIISHEIIIFHKKNIIWYFCLFNPKTFLIFAQKVQYNILLDMKIQEVMDIFGMEVKYEIRQTV